MRLLIAFAVAAAGLFSLAPAHAAEIGTIRGRVVNGATNEPQPGARVTLQGGNRDGSDLIRRVATTDAGGRFSFDGLETGAARVYVVDVRFEGGLFAGRAVGLPSDTSKPPTIDTEIRVWETTTDPTVIGISRDDIFLLPSDGGLSVIESLSIVNSSDLAYIGRGADDEDASERTPSIGFALPPGAEDVRILDSDLDIPELLPAEFGFGATVAIPPDLHRTTFTYRLPEVSAQQDISRTILYPTSTLTVYAQPPLTIESNRLRETGEETIEGTRYRVWESDERIDSGDSLQMLAIAEAGTPMALLAGVAAFVVVVLAGGGVALRRHGRRKRASPARQRSPGREAVLTAIARLDLDYQSGKVTVEAWERERARLKGLLAEGRTAP